MYVVVITTLLGATSGGYEPVAPILFAKENVDAYYLEFDDDIVPVALNHCAEVSPNKKVVTRSNYI